MKILITGAGGFIGGHLVMRLRSTEHEVYGLTRDLCDLHNMQAIHRTLDKFKPDVVIHLASHGKGMRFLGDVLAEQDMLFKLADSCLGRVKRFIAIGSADEFGESLAPQSEQSRRQPLSLYGMSKKSQADWLDYMLGISSYSILLFRPFCVYGEGQAPTMFIPELVQACLQNKPFEMTHGKQLRDFIHVVDVCDALIAGLNLPNDVCGQFNIGTGVGTTLLDVADKVKQLSASDISVKVGKKTNPHDPQALVADAHLAKAILGWEAKVSLDVGLQSVIEFEKEVEHS